MKGDEKGQIPVFLFKWVTVYIHSKTFSEILGEHKSH